MPEASPNPNRHASTAGRIGLGVMVLVGLVLGLLISAVTLSLILLITMGLGSFIGTLVAGVVLIVLFAGFSGPALWSKQ